MCAVCKVSIQASSDEVSQEGAHPASHVAGGRPLSTAMRSGRISSMCAAALEPQYPSTSDAIDKSKEGDMGEDGKAADGLISTGITKSEQVKKLRKTGWMKRSKPLQPAALDWLHSSEGGQKIHSSRRKNSANSYCRAQRFPTCLLRKIWGKSTLI
jgi:hypothetical protein